MKSQGWREKTDLAPHAETDRMGCDSDSGYVESPPYFAPSKAQREIPVLAKTACADLRVCVERSKTVVMMWKMMM
jgi:hypothetical protein